MCESDNEGITHLDVHDAMYMDVLITKPQRVLLFLVVHFVKNTHPRSENSLKQLIQNYVGI